MFAAGVAFISAQRDRSLNVSNLLFGNIEGPARRVGRDRAGGEGRGGLLVRPDDVDDDLLRDDEEVDRLVRETHTAFYHGVGTCRMGEPGSARVTDPDCRLIGVDGLSVVDASVIPTVPRTNTNLAAMATAEHVVTKRWGTS